MHDPPEKHSITVPAKHPDGQAREFEIDLLPAGATLFVRRLEPPARLEQGARVLVRHYITTRGEGRAFEVLAGMLAIDGSGTLRIHLPTRNSRLKHYSIIVREPALARRELADYLDSRASKPDKCREKALSAASNR